MVKAGTRCHVVDILWIDSIKNKSMVSAQEELARE